jgi:hypothetical protein
MCRDGFDCTYTKSVKGKLVLPIPVSEFTEAMRQELVKAIAESAGMFGVYQGNCVGMVTPFFLVQG